MKFNLKNMMRQFEIFRAPLYFKSNQANLFGWIHHMGHSAYDTAAIICSPIGKESNHTHRTVRHTADSLASIGIPTMRFDYFGTGDSDGNEFDQEIVDHWLADIKAASEFLKSQTACKKIIFIGIRIGATLSAILSKEIGLELLILWYPVYRGRTFFRELEITARTSVEGVDKSLPYFESAGFLVTKETEDKIKALNILNKNLKGANKVLILEHNESNDSEKFRSKLGEDNISFDHFSVEGMEDMFALPHLNKVPFITIDLIKGWVQNNLELFLKKNISLDLVADHKLSLRERDDYLEKALFFDSQRNLFGIYTKSQMKNTKPVILILNTGADHHVGSNRLSVFLTRQFGEIGYDTFRIDLSGLGDSIVSDLNLENVLFKKSTGEDIKSAVEFVQNNFENRPVILLGVCAGGQAIYLSGIDQPNLPVVDYIIINAIMYRWEDKRYEVFLNNLDDQDYIKSTLVANNLIQIISGKNKFKTIVAWFKKGLTIIKNRANIRILFPGIQADVNNYLKNKVPMTLFYSDNEYGHGLLKKHRRFTFRKLMKYEHLNIYPVSGADHVLSKYSSRVKLAEMLKIHVEKKFGLTNKETG